MEGPQELWGWPKALAPGEPIYGGCHLPPVEDVPYTVGHTAHGHPYTRSCHGGHVDPAYRWLCPDTVLVDDLYAQLWMTIL